MYNVHRGGAEKVVKRDGDRKIWRQENGKDEKARESQKKLCTEKGMGSERKTAIDTERDKVEKRGKQNQEEAEKYTKLQSNGNQMLPHMSFNMKRVVQC